MKRLFVLFYMILSALILTGCLHIYNENAFEDTETAYTQAEPFEVFEVDYADAQKAAEDSEQQIITIVNLKITCCGNCKESLDALKELTI